LAHVAAAKDEYLRHYLVEPTACTPASGWEKGQVENQVGLIRERFFTPKVRVKSFAELNDWLLDRCVAYAKASKHPEFKDRTVWQVFEAERENLIAVPGRFDGFHAVVASVSKTCLVCFDRNKYLVLSQAVGRPVEVQAYADRIVIRQDGAVVGEHARSFGRDQTIYDPWQLCTGAEPEARSPAQWRAVQELGAAGIAGKRAAQAAWKR